MPTMGVGNKEAVEDKLNAPFTATLKVLIWPLLDAIRKWPSGVAASEMPEQLSKVRPLAKGDPATAVKSTSGRSNAKHADGLVATIGNKQQIAGQVGGNSVYARACNRGSCASSANGSNGSCYTSGVHRKCHDTIGYAALVVDVSKVRLRAQGDGAQHYNKEQKQSETPRCIERRYVFLRQP